MFVCASLCVRACAACECVFSTLSPSSVIMVVVGLAVVFSCVGDAAVVCVGVVCVWSRAVRRGLVVVTFHLTELANVSAVRRRRLVALLVAVADAALW